MADQREDVLTFIRRNGPCLPVQAAKILNTNILFASAILSELVARKQLALSHTAIGGSKLYYLKGQEPQLLDRLAKNFKGREKEAYELIREQKILRDRDLEPWQRVALKILHDVAVPMTVKHGEETETFWRYALVPDAELESHLTTLLTPTQTTPIAQPADPAASTQTLLETQSSAPPLPVVQPPEEPALRNETLQQAMANLREELIREMKPQIEQPKQKKKPAKGAHSDHSFYTRVVDYFRANKIEIIKEEMIKKDKEFDYLVKIPTNIGPLPYYLKAKNKKSINEAELSLAYSEGQLKKLPTIMLVTGKPTKKAQIYAEQKLQGQLHIRELL